MTKKMKRDKTPAAVSDEVVAQMDVRLAYNNLIDNFATDQQALEEKIRIISTDDAPTKAPD